MLALRLLKEQALLQNEVANSTRQTLRLIKNQYRAGTVDYAQVLNAQINTYSAEKTANNVRGLEMSAAVALIKALGGGWCGLR